MARRFCTVVKNGYSTRAFLDREKRGFAEPKEVTVGDRQLMVFPVEYVLRKYA